MSIYWKLFISYGVMIGLIIMMGILVFIGVNHVHENVDSMYEERVVPLTTLAEISQLAENTRVQMVSAVLSQNEELTERAEQNLGDIHELLENYHSNITDSSEQQLFDEFVNNWNDFDEIVKQNIALIRNDDYSEAQAGLGRGGEPFGRASDQLRELIDLNEDISTNLYEASNNSYQLVLMLLLIAVGVTIAVAVIYAYFQGKSIIKPLHELGRFTEKIAAGDLTGDMGTLTKRKDEIGTLADNFQTMSLNLRTMLTDVISSSEQVAATSEQLMASAEESRSASEEITTSIVEVSEGAAEQTEYVVTAKTNTDEVKEDNKTISNRLHNVQEKANEVNDYSNKGNEVLAVTMDQMSVIQSQNDSLADVIGKLTKQSEEIGNIVEVITDIAEQTNLLALNAAIEAARAGEHGKGFAVVADEVRKLAEVSAESAASIQQRIGVIQTDMGRASHEMEQGKTTFKNGMASITEADQSFHQILNAVKNMNEAVKETMTASDSAIQSTARMAEEMERISEKTKSFTNSADHVAAGAEEQNATMDEISKASAGLAQRAEDLQTLASKFKVS
ncbi:methyl-accepting chemotaxis protein [Salipaludibacillus agaradhaerens]|uniref:Methyl-accepting chemotaxis protein n=1 Tax=Salipaludibacillus agaradhaerens TaxID=76935 RepID=A0A9Q4AYG7_SALAG|nr:methyl-accepting chemotaxis protein [Salipaludibacillus agaradhaerens]MCR6094973.1 methyl-accepting chemotaxis protein [Salipaludibacillus agaradhaerens]MCR6115469.1 methyl-accepting chemotaxis protein [Salipaludibacillus agaradhaerens]